MRYSRATILAGGLLAAALASGRQDVAHRAESMLARLCESLLDHADKLAPSDPAFGALRCPADNPVVHGHHTRAGEAVFPLALRYRKTGRYLAETLALGDWLAAQQQPEGAWLETPHSWWGTTAHQMLALAAAALILEPELRRDEHRARAQKWQEALTRAADFVRLRIRSDAVPLSYLPTAACALVLAGRMQPAPDADRHAAALIRAALQRPRRDGLFVEEGTHGVDVGLSLGQTIPMLALYAVLAQDASASRAAADAARTYLDFLWPDGTVAASWGSRVHRWMLWGSLGTYGPVAACALVGGDDGALKAALIAAADMNLRLLESCVLPSGLVGYGPAAAEPEFREFSARTCLYPTLGAAVGLAIALHWGDLARPEEGPPAPPVFPAAVCRVFPSCRVALVRTARLCATVSWSALDIPGVHEPRGGVITHLLFAGAGTVQLSTASLFAPPESLHMPRQEGKLPLTPRVECTYGERWYTNLFDRNTRLVEARDDPPKFAFSGTLCDASGRPSNITYRLTHRFDDTGAVHKVLHVHGRRSGQAVTIVEPFVWQAGWARSVSATSVTMRDAFRLQITAPSEGIILDVPADLYDAYGPRFPAVRTIPVVIRLAGPAVTTVRWTIEEIGEAPPPP